MIRVVFTVLSHKFFSKKLIMYILLLFHVCINFSISLRLCFIKGVIYNFTKRPRNGCLNLFENEQDIEMMNPYIVVSHRKKPPIYNFDDPLSNYRIDSYKHDKSIINLTSLPYVQIEHQDKGKLIPFRDGSEIISYSNNKLLTLLSNFNEWTKVYNPNSENVINLNHFNPLYPGTYYALVFLCSWQSESIALKKSINRLLGYYKFIRDPPVHSKDKKKRETLEELLEQVDEMNRLNKEYEERLDHCRKHGLPEPEPPSHDPIEQATFNQVVFEPNESMKILDYSFNEFKYRWWMPKFAQIKYNKITSKAFNEIYNTSYKKLTIH